ncbi:MAG: winged helix-turn-helix transcriptional regulator [Gemmatimonadales bacterium]|nr:MAG: winged helix-turn-helix transcriptional regulator [Gemmatimonadales bacterium]
MTFGPEAQALLDAHKIRILAILEQQPAAAAELPRRWPMSRPLLRHLLDQLELEGEVMVVARDRRSRARVYGINPYPRSSVPLERFRRAG